MWSRFWVHWPCYCVSQCLILWLMSLLFAVSIRIMRVSCPAVWLLGLYLWAMEDLSHRIFERGSLRDFQECEYIKFCFCVEAFFVLSVELIKTMKITLRYVKVIEVYISPSCITFTFIILRQIRILKLMLYSIIAVLKIALWMQFTVWWYFRCCFLSLCCHCTVFNNLKLKNVC